MKRGELRPAAFVFLALCVGLTACGGPSDVEQIASARAHLAARDDKTAMVELKAALQKNPSSAEARFLLGKALLKAGDAQGAMVELEKAKEANYGGEEMPPVLASAMMATGQAKKVSEQFADLQLKDPKAAAELKAALALSYIVQGKVDKGAETIKVALQLDPKNIPARMMNIRLAPGRGSIDEAISLVDALIADEPKHAEAHRLRGELLWIGKSDLPEAIRAFKQSVALDERLLASHLTLIRLYMLTQDHRGFGEAIAAVKRLFPQQMESFYFEGQQALIDGDLKRAREAAEQMLKRGPENAYVRQFAGLVELKSGTIQLAESHLNRAIQLAPTLTPARRQLAEAYLRLGQPAKALTTLQPLLEGAAAEPEALAMAAEAHLVSGDFAKAEEKFKLAAKGKPDDPRLRTSLALFDLARGRSEAGYSQLESVAASSTEPFADLALISAKMQRKDLDGALKAADRLIAKLPGKPLPLVLRGRVLNQRRDVAGAKESFEKALAADPAFYTAAAELATLDVAEGKPESAIKRFEQVLARDPQNYPALLGISTIRTRMGGSADVIEASIQDAIKASPKETIPRLALIDHHLAQRNAKKAVSVAQDALVVFPTDLQIQDALARAQLIAGDVQQAIAGFTKIAAAQPNTVQPLLRLADAHVANSNYAAARRSVRRALELAPDNMVARRGLVAIELADKQVDEAIQVARGVQKRRPAESVGYVIEGEVHASQRAWDKAIAAYRAGLERDRSVQMAMRLHAAYLSAQREPDAAKFASEWLQKNPADAEFFGHLGMLATSRGEFDVAEGHYRKALALQPKDASAANNVAWLLLKQGKPGALALAERANELLPGQPPFLDTLALALASEKKFDKAIEVERSAMERRPGEQSYRLNIARILIQADRKQEARGELEKLAALGAKFPDHAEVTKLLGTLGAGR